MWTMFIVKLLAYGALVLLVSALAALAFACLFGNGPDEEV